MVGHRVEEVLRSLLALGIEGIEPVLDTAVAAYLLDPSRGDYPARRGCRAVLPGSGRGVRRRSGAPAQARPRRATPTRAPPLDAVKEAGVVVQLVEPMRSALAAAGMLVLHDEVESPDLPGCWPVWRSPGSEVGTDEKRRAVSKELVAEVTALEGEIHELAGHPFNVNSTPQLRTVLYDEIGLTPGRRTKTGYSTDASTLEALRDQHPIVETLLRYRELEKLRSTYCESLLSEVKDDGRIHASFRQTVARTGRLAFPTSTTSRSAPTRGGGSGGSSFPWRASSSWWRTTTRSSCGYWPTWPETRACL